MQSFINTYKQIVTVSIYDRRQSYATVHYKADVASPYLMIVNISTGISYNYILNPLATEKTIDISSYANGLYEVILVCNANAVGNTTLGKN